MSILFQEKPNKLTFRTYYFINKYYMKSIQLVGYSTPVLIDSIGWLEGEANYTRIYYQNGTDTLVTQSLHWFEQHLDFIRVHRSTIVNPDFVAEFVHKSSRSGWVRLRNDRIIPVSRNRLDSTTSRLAAIHHLNEQPNLLTNEQTVS